MSQYRVQIDAKNLLVELNGKRAKHGFFSFRFVQADSPNEAADAAVAALRGDPDLLAVIKNSPDDPPRMKVMEVVATDLFPEGRTQPGRMWYEMKPKRWWQFWKK